MSRAAALLVALSTLSCTQVMDSTVGELALVDPAAPVWTGCHSSLGAYFLPKSFIRVEVGSYKQGNKPAFNVLDAAEEIIRPDSRRVFCLDHLTSIAASDQIIVKKTAVTNTKGGSQLLMTVASNSIDQSAVIIRRAIRAAFTAMSAFRSFREGDDPPVKIETLAKFEFDPFDQLKSAHANDRLRKTGFCLVLEAYTYSGPLRAADAYCKDPLRYVQRRKAPFALAYADYDTAPVAPRSPGIVYRPRVPFQLHIFMKDKLKDSEQWLLRKSMPVMLENISPILSLAVDRAAFTTKRLAFNFDNGSLQSMCLFKGSEALAAVSIPLEVVKSIVRLPTEMVQIQYDEVTQSKALVQAQSALLKAQDKYLTLLNSEEATTDAASGSIQQLDDKFGVEIAKTDRDEVAVPPLNDLSEFAKCTPVDPRDKAG
ncbi:MAG: hypothetical protein QOF14_5529 [Hyphomicrobiales bacterium]|jgi:hypothetical protein|nr:hypothetical protein [Hyphomicrobiales bacterium]